MYDGFCTNHIIFYAPQEITFFDQEWPIMFGFVENFVLLSLLGSLIGSGCTDCTHLYYAVHCSGYTALFSAMFCTVQFTQFKQGLNMFVA